MVSDRGMIGKVVDALDCGRLGGDRDCLEDTVRDVLLAIERAGYRVTRYRGTMGGAVNAGRRQSGGASRS